MRVGGLRHRITFQTNTPVFNSFGEAVDTYTDAFTVWSEIDPNQASRYVQAKQANADVSGVIHIRYRAGVLPTMRILFGARILKIQSIIIPDERRKQIDILYKELLD
jgi:SPP1 family predicted phage head-tail adaptor